MMNEKRKTVPSAMVRFCGMYDNIMRKLQESRASDEDYYAMALVDYEAKTITSLLGDFKWDKDDAKKKGSRASRSSSMNDEELVRLMVSEMALQNERAIEMQKEERLAFLEIKRREMDCRE
nr:hypothetical protein [Tanacetum cinerariifolium]